MGPRLFETTYRLLLFLIVTYCNSFFLLGWKGLLSTQGSAENQYSISFFPTCQVRVVRFYVSCLLLLSSPLLLISSPPPPRRPPRPTATRDPQCSLSDLNHDHPCSVFPAGPQPRVSMPSVPCRTSTTTIHAQCSLPDLNREYPRQKICHIECQKICQIEC